MTNFLMDTFLYILALAALVTVAVMGGVILDGVRMVMRPRNRRRNSRIRGLAEHMRQCTPGKIGPMGPMGPMGRKP